MKSVKIVLKFLGILLVLVLLYYIQLKNYLLFHSLTELFSIIIASAIFIVAWNGRKYLERHYLLLLGIAYLFIALLDLLHTLGYKGMMIFRDYDFYANQLWIAARFMESVSIFLALSVFKEIRIEKISLVFLTYLLVTAFFIYSIFFSDLFPICFVEGEGQTLFKVIGEYVINGILLAALVILVKRRKQFSSDIFIFMIMSIILTILSELAFTFYISNYGLSNMLGHYCKIISFFFLYQATVAKSISQPFATIFDELNKQKEKLKAINDKQNKLFSVISHDLRGSLGGLSVITESLMDKEIVLSDNDLAELYGNIHKSAKTNFNLTENLLYWARSHSEEIKLEFMNHSVSELISEASESLLIGFQLKNVGLEINKSEPLFVSVDKQTILIVIRNIISNALKFSPRGDVVVIDVLSDGRETRIRITDHGGGIDSQSLNKKINYHTTPGTEGEKGSGLGLHLIETYTALNGGEVVFDSSPGEGMTVTLKFLNLPDNVLS